MINKKGYLGQFIGFTFIIGLLVFTFMIINNGLDEMVAGCQGLNVTTTGCELISDGSPFQLLFTNKIILFIIIIIPFWIIVGRKIFRGILYGIEEFFESFESSNNNNYEKEKHLKKMKSKLKKELNRNITNTTKTKTETIDKGVQWGSGVELGKGMDRYETKLKGGNNEKDG